MIKSVTYLLIFPLIFISCTNKEDEIKSVVNKWNEIHNTHNAIELKDLYTPEVKFYGRQTPKETCYARKTILLTSDFHQDIVSPINISYYSTGIVKCDFTKRTMYGKDKLREYFCYLLLKKVEGKYLIWGESDSQSDQNRHVQLELGTKTTNPENRGWLIIASICLLMVILIAIWFIVKRTKKQNELEILKEQYKTPAKQEISIEDLSSVRNSLVEDFASKVKELIQEELKNKYSENSPEYKGYLFEKFIVSRFDPSFFELYYWRGDKYHRGIYAVSNKFPDLEYNVSLGPNKSKISVECKWRANFNNDNIEIAREDQMQNYRRYSKDENIKVFIILGVGGKPDMPADLYIIPLDKISGNVLQKGNLAIFKQESHRTAFFYDTNTKTLK